MRSSDDLPPDERVQGAGADGEAPQAPHEGEPYDEPLSVEDAEARLRDFAALSDSQASFAGPDDESRRSRRRSERRGERHEEHQHAEHHHEDHYYGDYAQPRSSGWRWAIRIAVPVVFLGVVIALVLVVMSSGILGGSDATVSPSPSVSPSKGTTVVTVKVYKVKKGDTLSQIADRFGTSVDKLLEANPKIDINNLSVGTKIKIPAP